jgi:hypothetical protein
MESLIERLKKVSLLLNPYDDTKIFELYNAAKNLMEINGYGDDYILNVLNPARQRLRDAIKAMEEE